MEPSSNTRSVNRGLAPEQRDQLAAGNDPRDRHPDRGYLRCRRPRSDFLPLRAGVRGPAGPGAATELHGWQAASRTHQQARGRTPAGPPGRLCQQRLPGADPTTERSCPGTVAGQTPGKQAMHGGHHRPGQQASADRLGSDGPEPSLPPGTGLPRRLIGDKDEPNAKPPGYLQGRSTDGCDGVTAGRPNPFPSAEPQACAFDRDRQAQPIRAGGHDNDRTKGRTRDRKPYAAKSVFSLARQEPSTHEGFYDEPTHWLVGN